MFAPLTITTAPQFNLESFDSMFGHPGISTFGYAGVQAAQTKQHNPAPSKETLVSRPQNDDTPSPQISEEDQLLVSQAVAAEANVQQRRRGTFLNHTPRVFEARSPKKMDGQQAHPHESYQSSSDGDASGQRWEYKPWDADNDLSSREVSSLMRQDEVTSSKPSTTNPVVANISRKQVPSKASINAQSYRAPRLGQAHNGVSNGGQGSVPPPPVEQDQSTPKKRRRQTPYKLPSTPTRIPSSRYSPLEPLVEKHRRQANKSTVASLEESLVPEDIQAIGAASTERAIQEYFDSQPSTASTPASRRRSSNPPDAPLPMSPGFSIPSSPPTLLSLCPVEPLREDETSTPELPSRSPLRLTQSPSHPFPVDKARGSGDSTDFDSAARGKYSPYENNSDEDEDDGALVVGNRRAASPYVGQAATPGRSARGRMAPPILGPKEFTAKATENDLSYYLKNTGPPEEKKEEKKEEKSKKTFRIFSMPKARKASADRAESDEKRSGNPKHRPLIPACARETTTSSGAKHLQIIIKDSALLNNQTLTLPVHSDQNTDIRVSRHISVAFTEEMLNPLGSPALETAISGFNCPNASPVQPGSPTLMRGSRRSPMTSTMMPADDHPLASREELTRARKLRDLKRVKKAEDGGSKSEMTSRATQTAEDQGMLVLPTRAQSPLASLQNIEEQDEHAPKAVTEAENADGDVEEEEDFAERMARMKRRSVSVQRLLTEVTEELARVIGLDAEDGEGDLSPETVLQYSRRIRVSRDDYHAIGERE